MALAGTDGVGLGYMKLWDCIMTTEFDIIVPESAASSIGLINLEMNITVKAQCGKSARWVCRGGGWKRTLGTAPAFDPTWESIEGRFLFAT